MNLQTKLNLQKLPVPPVPPGLDTSRLEWMPLRLERLFRSRTWLSYRRDPQLGYFAINLWSCAFRQAGGLENDPDVLADAAKCPPELWDKIGERMLSGWMLHSDGRLYHPVVVEMVLEATTTRRQRAEACARARAAKAAKRSPRKTTRASTRAQLEAPPIDGATTGSVIDDQQKIDDAGALSTERAIPSASSEVWTVQNEGPVPSAPAPADPVVETAPATPEMAEIRQSASAIELSQTQEIEREEEIEREGKDSESRPSLPSLPDNPNPTPPVARARASEATEPATGPDGERVTSGSKVSSKYAFEANVIRLVERDLSRWRQAFTLIADLEAELTAIDAKLTDDPPAGGKWFGMVAGWLAKKNERLALARAAERAASEDNRPDFQFSTDMVFRPKRFEDGPGHGPWDKPRWQIEKWQKSGLWCGVNPPPGQQGCDIPAWLQREYGIEPYDPFARDKAKAAEAAANSNGAAA